MKFLASECPGCYHQKVIDLNHPPALPKHVLLYRARGVEEMDREDNMDSGSDASDSVEDEDKLDKADEDDED